MKRFKVINRISLFLIAAGWIVATAVQAQHTKLLMESFENGVGTVPPAGWAIEQVTGTDPGISFETAGINPVVSAAFDKQKFVRYHASSIMAGSTRLRTINPCTTINHAYVMVEFAWYEDPGFPLNGDKADVQWSTDGVTWNTAQSFLRYNAVDGWKDKFVILPAEADNQPAIYFGILLTSANGNNCALDRVKITEGPMRPPGFITIGTGSTAVGYPFNTLYMGARTQMLFTATQLIAAGATVENFLSIGFNFATVSVQPMTNFTIKMGLTASSTLTGWITTGMTTVYSSVFSVPGTDWRDFTLSPLFAWNGYSNLVVEVCFGDNGSYTSNSTVFGTVSSGTTLNYHADNYAGCTGTAAGSAQTVTPNIRLGIPNYCPGLVTGYVIDAHSGDSIPGANVMVGSNRDTSDASGFYCIYNLPAGPVTINCTAYGYVSASTATTIVNCQTIIQYISLIPGPQLSGFVTDTVTGAPVVGASITVDGVFQTLSVSGGYYITPPMSFGGAKPVKISKTGYDDYIGTVNLIIGVNTIRNGAILPSVFEPHSITAALNGPPATAVNVSWDAPWVKYELLYDDGIKDYCTVWNTPNNLNAVRFTPQGYPCQVSGGKINICDMTDYSPQVGEINSFYIFLMKADGPGGMPGTVMDSVLILQTYPYFKPSLWLSFSFNNPVTLTSGDYYLVVRQSGVPPQANRLGVDMSNPAGRSYSKSVTGGGSWVPEYGNYMIRSEVTGPGIVLPSDNPLMNTYNEVWRVVQGGENIPALWSPIYIGNGNSTVDTGWPSLACNPYRWVVRTFYGPPENRWSNRVFSNVIGKCWTADVNICVIPSCAAQQGPGTMVRMANVNTDTVYNAVTDAEGCVNFHTLWKGTYTMTVSRFSYPTFTETLSLFRDSNITVSLLQQTPAPTQLNIDDQRLKVSWNPPVLTQEILNEDFSAGFYANQWTAPASGNWIISSASGNPSPAAMFRSYPPAYNYDQYLTSKSLIGMNSPHLKLKFDIFLSVYDTSVNNFMTVELRNGSVWSVLKTYSARQGNIPWTTVTLDITAVAANSSFNIRFHNYGYYSYALGNWIIDNVKIIGVDNPSVTNPCLSGYKIYLDNVLSGTSADTTYTIPPQQVVYGHHYNACVDALYNIGVSPRICDSFASKYLPPVGNLAGNGLMNTCTLTWDKPQVSFGEPIGLNGYNIYRGGNLLHYNPDEDSLNYTDTGLNPGTYTYDVKAKYDLAPYGFPGQWGEAYSPAQISVTITGVPYFIPAWTGAAINPMRVAVAQATCQGSAIGIGDEVGIFDGPVCIGAVKLTGPISPGHPPVIILSEDNPATPQPDGFTPGDSIIYKIWKNLAMTEFSNVARSFPMAPNYVFDHFVPGDTAVVSLFTFNVPAGYSVQDTTVGAGQSACFNATQNIYVAGNGTFFHVPAGGNVTMIAGSKIIFYPGTAVFSGGYLHGYITANNLYCNGMPPYAPLYEALESPPVVRGTDHFTVYPNPVSGKCFIALPRGKPAGPVDVGVYAISGKLIRTLRFNSGITPEIDMERLLPGLYFFRISTATSVETHKVIR